MMRTVILLVLLAALSMASAAKCPSFMHSVSNSEKKYAYPIGVDAFENYPQKICASLPQWIFDLKAYNAKIKPQCTNGKKGGTSSFSMTFSPEEPCKSCDARYCKKSGSSCTCTLPKGYTAAKAVTVYTKPQECSPLAVVDRWEAGSVTMSPNNLPYDDLKCPTDALHRPKDAAQRATLAQVAEQYFKEYAYHLYNQTSAFCDEGAVQSFEISNVSGCLKTPGQTYKGEKYTYGPNDSYAQVRAVVKYSCPHAGRSQTMGISYAAGRYNSECKPVIFVE